MFWIAVLSFPRALDRYSEQLCAKLSRVVIFTYMGPETPLVCVSRIFHVCALMYLSAYRRTS